MRGKTRSVLILIILFSIILIGCGSVNDSLTSGEKGEVTIDLSPTTKPILSPTPEPTPTPDPTPTPIPEPLYYQYKGTNAFPTIEDYGEYYIHFYPYEKWLLTDEGIQSRIDYCMNYKEISEDEAIKLLVSYYGLSADAFDPVNFEYEEEMLQISDYIYYAKEFDDLPSDGDDVQNIIDAFFNSNKEYENGIVYILNGYQINLDDTGDIHTSLFDTIDWDYVEEEETQNEKQNLPISSNGHELKFGDKVAYDPGGFSSYGGTVYEVNGSSVKVRWERSNSPLLFNGWQPIPSSHLDQPILASGLGFNVPSDTKYYDASVLKKIDFLSW